MDWLEEISDDLLEKVKHYIGNGRFIKYEDTYKGLDIFRYRTKYGNAIITVITHESSPKSWVEFDEGDIEKAYDWIDVYKEKGEEAAEDFYFNFLYPDDPEDVPAKYTKEELTNKASQYDIDDDRIFDWRGDDKEVQNKDYEDIENYLLYASDTLPEYIKFHGLEIITHVRPATYWEPEDYDTTEVDHDYWLTDWDKKNIIEHVVVEVLQIPLLYHKALTGKEVKELLNSKEAKEAVDDYAEGFLMDDATKEAQDAYNDIEPDYEYEPFESLNTPISKPTKEEKKEEKKMNLKEYLESFDDMVEEEVEDIKNYFSIAYLKDNDIYQSILVKAETEDEARNKFNKQMKDAEIVDVRKEYSPEEEMRKGKPLLEEITDDVSVRDWYIKTFPNDELGYEIDDYIKFEDIQKALEEGEPDVYEVIGVADSIVRERLFQKLADLTGVSYDDIYEKWINAGAAQSEKNTNWYNPEEDDDL